MIRSATIALALIALLAGASPASAQDPLPPAYPEGPLVPSEFAAPPQNAPRGPLGEYPEDWARCVRDNPPPPQQYPRDLDVRGVDPGSPNPLVGTKYFVDRVEPAYTSWRRWLNSGETTKADTIWRLAREPRFRWFGRFTSPHMPKKVRGFLDRVQCDQPGGVPMMTVMRHQGRDCDSHYLAGGRAEDRRTMKWYDDFAAAVGGSRVVIAFEPDSLGTIDCLAPHRRPERLRMLAHGVDVLSQLPNATVYLEAGASDWEPAERTAKQLRIIGIRKVRGFMLNGTHHDWTRNNIRHGLDLSRRVGGKPFIVNTSYNGRGPLHYRRWPTARRHVAAGQRLVPSRAARPRPRAHHGHVPPARGRLHVRQSPRLLGGGVQRRAAADRHLVARAGADVRRVRHQLGDGAGGHQPRPLQALLATRPRRLRLDGSRGLGAPGPPMIPGRDR